MKYLFKKISAITASVLITGMTIGVAAAAAFPTDFISATPAIVYGASADPMDLTQANSISTYLADKVPKTGGGNITGESFKLEKSSTKWQTGMGLRDVVATNIIDDNLPTILKDGKYIDDDNDEFDYTQKITPANLSLTMWEDSDYKSDVPTLGIRIASGANVLNYTLTMTDQPLVSDLPSTDLEMMGKKFFILTIPNSTSLIMTMLDSAESKLLAEGETATVSGHEVSVNFVTSTPKVKLDVDGEITNSLAAGETQKLKDGSYVGIKEINYNSKDTGISSVKFSIGKGKLKLTNGADVELNDNTISGLVATINYTGSSSDIKLTDIKLAWATDGDSFVTLDESTSMPGFGAVKISTTGMNYPKEEKITIKGTSTTKIQLVDFPLKDSTETIPLLYGDSVNFTFPGDSADKLLRTTNNTELIFDGDTDQYFIASWTDNKDAESYLMRATSFSVESSVNKTDLEYRKDGAWVKAKEKAKDQDSLTIGNVELTVGQIEKNAKWVKINASTNVNFNTLYSKEGLKLWLPFLSNGTNYNVAFPGIINESAKVPKWNLTMQEEDKNENKAAGKNLTVTLGWNAASTAEAEVTVVTGAGGTDTEIDDTNVFRNFVYSALGTEYGWKKPSSGTKSLEVTYHGAESYGEIYITESAATTGTAGNMVFKDSEKTSWETKNVIIVGGSCINTAAATALGVASGTCAEAFTTATSVGSGQFLIQSIADKFTTGKIALVVAGYEKADTKAAADRLVNEPATIDTTKNNKYIFSVGLEGTSLKVSGP